MSGLGAFPLLGAASGMAAILSRIRAPRFPKRDFLITDFGATGDGTKDNTEALRRAVEACHRAGGGRVVVARGTFLTAAVHLRSNVNLHLAEGAVLRFDRDPRRYLPAVFTRWEGVEVMNYSPFIYGYGLDNIAITGSGTLDGGAGCGHWWPWKGRTDCGWKKGDPSQQQARNALFEMAEKDVPVEKRVFGEGGFLRPNFIQPYRCRNVLVEGVTIINSPMWEVHPVLSTNVIVRGVKVNSHGPNNDGCNPESCRDVLIEECVFDTGDDCIALKSGRNRDGRRLAVPCENVVIRRSTMKDGHGGLTIGSEISGGCRNIFAEDCRMDSPNLDRVLRIKTNSYRGGTIQGVYCRDLEVGQVSGAAVEIDFHYEEGAGGPHLPTVRDIEVRHLRCRQSARALNLRGFKDAPIRGVLLEDCVFDNASKKDTVENVEGLRLVRVKINGKDAAGGKSGDLPHAGGSLVV